MRVARFGLGLAALVLGAHLLAAQEPTPTRQPPGGPGGMNGMGAQMQMMDSMNARLDSLVGRMNRATGGRKITAMADVINELVAQRKGMQARMRQMVELRGGMMDRMGGRAPAGQPAPTPGPDSTPADTAGRANQPPR